NLEGHDQYAKCSTGVVLDRMLHARREISEVIRMERMCLVPVVKCARAFQDKIDFFLTIIDCGVARSASVDCGLAKTRDAPHTSILIITLAEDRLVVTGSR